MTPERLDRLEERDVQDVQELPVSNSKDLSCPLCGSYSVQLFGRPPYRKCDTCWFEFLTPQDRARLRRPSWLWVQHALQGLVQTLGPEGTDALAPEEVDAIREAIRSREGHRRACVALGDCLREERRLYEIAHDAWRSLVRVREEER